MSKAQVTFESSIRDAEELLAHFDSLNKLPPPDNAEVLKRAGLVMALTAWETYVEDLVREARVGWNSDRRFHHSGATAAATVGAARWMPPLLADRFDG
jgi:hypothetical protein